VIAGASTDEKLELARSRGADETFNYSKESIKAKVMALTGDRGVDVVYDPVGADFAEQAVRSIAWNGRYLVIGFAGGKIPAVTVILALLKGCSLVGVFGGANVGGEPEVPADNLKMQSRLFVDGKIKPPMTELE